MTIIKHKGQKNVWRIQVSKGINSVTRKRHRPSEIFRGTKREAMRRETKLKSSIDRGVYVDRQAETMSEFVARWFPGKQASVAVTTAEGYRRLLNSHILPRLGTLRLQAIKSSDISRILDRYTERGAISMAEHIFIFLRMLFNKAVKMEAIPKSPMSGVEPPHAIRRELRSLTSKEWRMVAKSLESQSVNALAICTVMVSTGIRRSELAGLQWRDADLDNKILHIRRSYHVVRGEGVYKNPKTARSTRNIPIDGVTVTLLREQLKMAQRFASLAERPMSLTAPIFTPDGIHPYAPDSISHMWQKASRTVGLGDVRLQDLRHTTATLLLGLGINMGTVSDRLGHATPGFTLNVYRHEITGEQEDATNRLGNALSGKTASDADQTG